jgi:hypothetical protein
VKKKRVVLSCCCLAIGGGGAIPAIITNAAAIYVCPKPPTVYTHSYKSYVTSAYWAHKFKVHNRNMKRGGKVSNKW